MNEFNKIIEHKTNIQNESHFHVAAMNSLNLEFKKYRVQKHPHPQKKIDVNLTHIFKINTLQTVNH